MIFRVTLPVEIQRPGDELATWTSVPVQLVCQGGKWRGQCQSPPIATLMCDTLPEALAAAVKEIAAEWELAAP